MRLIEGIEYTGTPFEIPDCGRDDLPEFFKEMGYTIGVEVGVLRGEFTEKLCKPGLKVYGVDPYEGYRNYRRDSREEPYEVQYKMALDRLAPYDCTIIRKLSADAAMDFKDESLDFVYIDGNHTIPYVVSDIYEWNRRIRVGGVISGHDYGLNSKNPYSFQACHVVHAVKLMTGILGVKNWYLLGEYRPEVGDKRDKWRSWMWIKKH